MPGLKLFISDYDLTLVDSLLDFYEAFATSLREFGGGPVSFESFYEHFKSDRLNELLPRGVNPSLFWHFFRSNYSSRSTRPYDFAGEFLRLLKSIGVKVLVVTGRFTPSTSIREDLRRFGLDEYVDEVYTAYDIPVLNGVEEHVFDKTWLIKWLLERYGVEPCEAVYIGDYTSDLESALKAGVRFVGVSREHERRRVLEEKGARVFSDLIGVFTYLYTSLTLEQPCNGRQAP